MHATRPASTLSAAADAADDTHQNAARHKTAYMQPSYKTAARQLSALSLVYSDAITASAAQKATEERDAPYHAICRGYHGSEAPENYINCRLYR